MLTIKDLSVSRELDQNAMQAVAGGYNLTLAKSEKRNALNLIRKCSPGQIFVSGFGCIFWGG